MKKNVKYILIFLCLLTLVYLVPSKKINNTKEQKITDNSQELFCKIINDSRKLYIHEKNNDFYIDKEKSLNDIFYNRTQSLKQLLGYGQVYNWNGKIKNILVSNGKGAFIEIELPCKVRLVTQDNLIIPIDSHLYEKLRKYSENSHIEFSGSFLTEPSSNKNNEYPYKSFYGETSFTKIGSMEEPEFLFKYFDFHIN
jgi:hypothetical protein